MNGYLITLIVLFTIGIAYLILFLANLIFIWLFSVKLKQHNKALTIILVQKYEAIESLFKIYEKNGIKVKDDLVEKFANIDINNFEKLDTKESFKDRECLSILKQELLAMVKNNEDFQKNEEFQMSANMLMSIDVQYRNVSACYNADVIGYNYWIRFKVFQYLYIYNHVELKDIIS